MNLRTFLVLVFLGAVMLLVSITLYGLVVGGSATFNVISGGAPMQVLKDNPGKQVIALSRTLSDQSGEKRYNCYVAL